jgi:hypothetical protein
MTYGKPLTDALLTGIDKRFGKYFDRKEFIVAAVTLPMFRLRWVDGDQTKMQYRELTLEAMKEVNSATTGLQSNNTSADDGSDNDDKISFHSNLFILEISRRTSIRNWTCS